MDTKRRMITFKENGSKFTYRVAGIAYHEGQVLFQRAMLNPQSHFLPGGRAEMGESAEETLRREMQEELDLEAKIERLVYIVENFYEDHQGLHHELGMYFLMTFAPNAYLYQGPRSFERAEEDGLPMIFDWLPVAQVEQLAIYPEFLKQRLKELPSQTTHIVQNKKEINLH